MGLISEASTVYPQSYPQQLHGSVDGLIVLTDSPAAVEALQGRFEAAVSVINPHDWIGWMSPWRRLEGVDIVLAATEEWAAEACVAALETGRAVRELEVITADGEHVARFGIRGADYLERELARVVYEEEPRERQGAIHHLTRRCAGMVPLDYSAEEIVERMTAVLPRSETGLVRPVLETAFSDIWGRAVGWRSVTEESHPHDVQQRPLDMSLLEEIAQSLQTIYILDTPTGSGKTKLIRELIEWLKAERKTLCVTHRRSISRTYADQLPHYEALDIHPGEEHTVPGLAVCVNSLAKHHIWEIAHDTSVLVLEETLQLYRHLVSDGTDERALLFERLSALVAKADIVVAADADANDFLVRLLAEAGEGKRIIRVHQSPALTHLRAKMGRHAQILEEAKNSAMTGTRTLIATDASPQTVDGLARRFDAERRRVLAITGETVCEPEVQSFLADPDGALRSEHYDVLIYNPAITSSVSITHPHFEAHYGLFSGVVTADDAVQMLRRDRTARVFRIGVQRPRRWEDDHAGSLLNRALRRSGRAPDDASAIERVCARVLAEENASRNRIAASLWAVLEHQGVEVTTLTRDAGAASAGWASGRDAAKQGREAYNQRILEAGPATLAEVRDQCPRDGESRRDLDARLDRRTIERYFQTSRIGTAELTLWDRGALIPRLDNLTYARISPEHARSADARERGLPFVDRRHHALRRALLQELLQRLRLDLDADGDLGFDDALARSTLRWLVGTHLDDMRKLGLASLERGDAKGARPSRTMNALLWRLFALRPAEKRIQENGRRQRWYRIGTEQRALFRTLLANHPGPVVAGRRGRLSGGGGGAGTMSDEEFASLCQWLDERR